MKIDNEIDRLLLLDDEMKISVIGFSLIEEKIEDLIELGLESGHRVEIKKMSTMIKVDLAIGLGVLPPDYKGVIKKLYKLRCEYAHKIYIGSFPKEIDHIELSLSPSQRDALKETEKKLNKFEILRYATISTIFSIEQCVKNYTHKLETDKKTRVYNVKPTFGLGLGIPVPSEKMINSLLENMWNTRLHQSAQRALDTMNITRSSNCYK
ncbi:hypothetical protein GOU96_18050 [Vibrio sp. R-1]|uniref:hypothetical protein n=1 Tax=Vibrio TaxID=662 RepID=UPI00226DD547|nr:hypothetical protein [Vibrio sp. R-1]EKF9208300.1 hypothetical protein [Vibrio cholerae]MCX9457857.1 hypothetical protein [Vibrio cholerae]MEB3778490.1 hypothetical protein [Vibrio sp. R-1]